MIFDSFNNRDWSLFIWTLLFFGFALWAGRQALPALFKSLFNKYILIPVLLMFGYSYLGTYLFYKVGFWNTSMIKDTLLWIAGVGFPMFFQANAAAKGKYRLRSTLIDNLKLTALVEFIVNLYVFPLWIELLFIPCITLIALLMVVAESKPEYKPAHKFLNFIASIVGIILFYHAIKFIAADFKGFATFNNLESFIYPIAMTAIYLPFIYLMTLYMAYEEFFVRIRIAYRHDKLMEKFARRQVIRKGKFNLQVVIAIAKNLKIYDLQEKQDFIVAIDGVITS